VSRIRDRQRDQRLRFSGAGQQRAVFPRRGVLLILPSLRSWQANPRPVVTQVDPGGLMGPVRSRCRLVACRLLALFKPHHPVLGSGVVCAPGCSMLFILPAAPDSNTPTGTWCRTATLLWRATSAGRRCSMRWSYAWTSFDASQPGRAAACAGTTSAYLTIRLAFTTGNPGHPALPPCDALCGWVTLGLASRPACWPHSAS